MHMKYEKINLALVILVPTIFIIGLVMGLLYEGNALTYAK
jgi:cytochrome c oxidase subunit IV